MQRIKSKEDAYEKTENSSNTHFDALYDNWYVFCHGGGRHVEAASKPGKPVIKLLPGKEKNSIKIAISKTERANGYYIYMKMADDDKYKKLKTLRKDGTQERNFTVKNLCAGEYCFKVRAYTKIDAKIKKGKFSDEKQVTIKSYNNELMFKDEDAFLDAYYPGVKAMKDSGKIGTYVEYKKNTILLGNWDCESYEYTKGFSKDGKKDTLEWEVLDYSDDGRYALVISKKIICVKDYSDSGNVTSWENSSLRQWLNRDFLNGAFSEDERALIKQTKNKNVNYINLSNDNLPITEERYSPDSDYKVEKNYVVKEEKDTRDNIFLLSRKEIIKYFGSYYNEFVYCWSAGGGGWFTFEVPVSTNTFEGLYSRCCPYIDDEVGNWWLRDLMDSGKTLIVNNCGEISSKQMNDNYKNRYDLTSYVGVRPVFWIELTDEIITQNNINSKSIHSEYIDDVKVYFGARPAWTNYIGDPIEWSILDIDSVNNKMLLLCTEVTTTDQFDEVAGNTDWEHSDLRSFLNGFFYSNYFTEEEKTQIILSDVVNEDNDKDGTPGGKNTQDYVFLLSVSELEQYIYKGNRDDYAYKRLAMQNNLLSNWWLRTPAGEGRGAVNLSDGKISVNRSDNRSGVRPAVWIKIDP